MESYNDAPNPWIRVLSLESILRPLVMTIVLGLIWLGAARMPASAQSRYTTAGVLSVVFIGWEVVAQYLGATNTYLATIENPPQCRPYCSVC
jgi:hypothetical protein